MQLANLLWPATSLRLENLEVNLRLITLTLVSTQPTPICPTCSQTASRVHSRYARTLADLPWAGVQVCWHLRVRRFFCDNAQCSRLTFAERFPDLAPIFARRTK